MSNKFSIITNSGFAGTRSGYRWLNPASFLVASGIILLMVLPLIQSPKSSLFNCNLGETNCIISAEGVYNHKLISQGEGLDDSVFQAINAYDAQNYEQAIPLFQQLLRQPLSPFYENEIRLCLGVSLILINDIDKAYPHFQTLLQNPNMEYQLEARWYLALLELRKNNREKAIMHLQEINLVGFHASSSQKLLKIIGH